MRRKLLIVDDIKVNRRMLARILADQYDILEAENGESALAVMRAHAKTLSAVLLDIVMPVMDGYGVLAQMMADSALSQIPVIVTTGNAEGDAEIKALTLGALDFIAKPYVPDIIRRRLENLVRLRETAATVNALERDALTRLYVREAFIQKAEELIRAQPPDEYTMACFDIDGFKVINDQYGNDLGDCVLRHVANVFRGAFEPGGGVVCRVSADNFAVLYPAGAFPEEKLAAIRARAAQPGGGLPALSFCVGRYRINDLSLSVSAMYDRARIAAASVKGRFDAQIACYDESMRLRLLREKEIIDDMKPGLEKGQFEVWFQPQYNHASGALIGAEALVRWRHPEKGLISPGVFIPIFESNGFVYELDKFVWRKTCALLRHWLNSGRKPLPVSVNISRYDILREDLFSVITGLVREYALPLELLRLEVTESAFSTHTQKIIDVVTALIQYGFTVEIDDFGSGYSSLNTLKDVPTQIVKLDMRFLEGKNNTDRGGSIVQSIVRMTKWLGMSVIAEGVETAAQANYLKSIGCNYVQGYLYARPMPQAEYEALARGASKEETLIALTTVENLNSNAFWSPESMDTLIFNSYVGGACIFEYGAGHLEILRATDKFPQAMGARDMTVTDALALDWAAYMTPEGRACLTSAVETAIRTRDEVSAEYTFEGLPGCAPRTCIRSGLRAIASAGDRYLIYCTNENITAQKELEARQSETARRLDMIVNSVSCGIATYLCDESGVRIQYFNDGYANLFGYAREEYAKICETGVTNLTLPEDVALVKGAFDALLKRGEPLDLTFRVRHKSGEMKYVNLRGDARETRGGARSVNTVMFDVTKTVRAREEARVREQEIRLALTHMGKTLCEYSPAARTLTVPDSLARRYGRASGVIENMPDVMIQSGRIDAATLPDFQAMYGAILRGEPTGGAEYREKQSDGAYHWQRAEFTTIYGGDGRPVKAMIAVEETTREHLKYDLELRRPMMGEKNMIGRAVVNLSAGGEVLEYYRAGGESVPRAMQTESFGGGQTLDSLIPNPESRARYRETHNPEWLLNAYARGETEHSLTYIRRRESGNLEWVRNDLRLTQKPGGTDVLLFEYCYTIEDEKTLELLTRILKRVDYDLVLRIHAGTGTYARLGDEHAQLAGDIYAAARAYARAHMRPDDAEALLKDCERGRVARELSVREPFRITFRTLAEDGEARHKRLSFYYLDRERDLILATVEDITSLMREEALKSERLEAALAAAREEGHRRLRETAAQLKLILNHVNGGMSASAMLDGKVKFLFSNEAFYTMLGYTRTQFERELAGGYLDAVHPADRARVKAFIAETEKAGSGQAEYRAVKRDGSVIWLRTIGSVCRVEGVDAPVHVVVNSDITREREAAENLRIAKEQFRVAALMGGRKMARYDIRTRVYTHEDETLLAMGFKSRIENMPQAMLESGSILPECESDFLAFYAAIARGDEDIRADVAIRTENGAFHWTRGEARVIFDAEGAPAKAIIIFSDITELREKEAVYRKWQQSLALRDAQSYTLFRCNLSKNADYDSAEGTLLPVNPDEKAHTFDQHTRAFSALLVYPEDRARYEAFLSADTLLAGYYRGTRAKALDFRAVLAQREPRWLRLSVELVEFANSTDVEAYLMYEDIDQEKRAEIKNRELAETDPLTGILNRAAFIRAAQARMDAPEAPGKLAFFMLDIDGFKLINDTFGHGVGDQVLVDAAKTLKSVLRPGDLLGRFGGDEFLVCLPGMPDEESIARKAAQICTLLHKALSMEVYQSASLGIALYPDNGTDYETLYGKMDAALYHVKNHGKNNYAFYQAHMDDEAARNAAPDDVELAAHRKKRRLLIVEDNQINLTFLETMFEEEFTVLKAQNGAEALSSLRRYGVSISAVLLDLVMPGMDGFAVLETMRMSEEMRTIPVIVVSGLSEQETSLRTLRCGAADFVTKPVNPDLLRLRVQSVISKAENDRLRAQNSLLLTRNSEIARYKTALDSARATVVEYQSAGGVFFYDAAAGKRIAARFDERDLWEILPEDHAAAREDAENLKRLAQKVAACEGEAAREMTLPIKTPARGTRDFRVLVKKQKGADGFPDKVILTFMETGDA